MTRQTFSLISCSIHGHPDLTITGQVARRSNTFSIRYVLAGNLSQVALPALNADPARKDELWRTTCFEFFLAIKNQRRYWEFNLSPSGDWNVYVMDGYRQLGMRKETRINSLTFEIQKDSKSLSLELNINLDLIIERKLPIEVGIATVIQRLNGQVTYWALMHPRPEADFHLREGFVLAFY